MRLNKGSYAKRIALGFRKPNAGADAALEEKQVLSLSNLVQKVYPFEALPFIRFSDSLNNIFYLIKFQVAPAFAFTCFFPAAGP